jgi:dolichol-phosphate mannosyltransferase
MKSRAVAILPTYNERENIVSALEGVLSRPGGFDAMVVDDMSPDGTAALVRERFGTEPRVILIERGGPRGRGYAGVEGFRQALALGYDYIFEMDADGSHDPAVLDVLLEALGRADAAIASRLIPGGGERGRSAARRWMTLAANVYLRASLGLKTRDCTTGFRGFRRETLEAVPWEKLLAAGPAVVQEVLFAVESRGFAVEELPFMFEERRSGDSKLNWKLLVAGLAAAPGIRRRLAPEEGEMKLTEKETAR